MLLESLGYWGREGEGLGLTWCQAPIHRDSEVRYYNRSWRLSPLGIIRNPCNQEASSSPHYIPTVLPRFRSDYSVQRSDAERVQSSHFHGPGQRWRMEWNLYPANGKCVQ